MSFHSGAWLGLACWLQAAALPGGLALSPTMARLGPGGNGPAWAWRAPAHTHKTHTPPHLNEVNLVCAVKTHTPPSPLYVANEKCCQDTHTHPLLLVAVAANEK